MTTQTVSKNLTTGAKVFLVVAAVLGVISLIDFLFYGRNLTDLVVAVGFALMFYGTTKNGLQRFRDRHIPVSDKRAQYASGVGTILVLGSIAASYML